MGIELELQLVDLHNFNLVMEAKDFLRRLSKTLHSGEIKPEITQSMIELNSSIHESYSSLLCEVQALRDFLIDEADKTHIGICGGGIHPFQKWKEQRIFPTDRFINFSEQYGYLAKKFTVFGQHIHIGCDNGNDALYLCHALARYIPQFIALSASSPFYQKVDTLYDCSRLAIISSFPLSGTPPWILKWPEFEAYFNKMVNFGVVKSMKDFYWDIRPKPEFGTIELRICDTPLEVETAADLAAYLQLLACWLLEKRPKISKDIYLTYPINRFKAARYGLDADFIDPLQQTQIPLAKDIIDTCDQLSVYALKFGTLQVLKRICHIVQSRENDATWLKKQYADNGSFNDTVRNQTLLWRGKKAKWFKTPLLQNFDLKPEKVEQL